MQRRRFGRVGAIAADHRMGHRRAAVVLVVLGLLPLLAVEAGASGAGGLLGSCPRVVDAGTFAETSSLRAATEVMADLGPRPTASPAQLAYIDTIEERLRGVDGVAVSELAEEIDLQLDRDASLTITEGGGADDVPVAGAVPYATPTDGSTGRLVHVPTGTAIADVDVDGAVVVRPAATSGIQYALFAAVAYYLHDPGLTINPLETYERDNFGYVQRVTDLRQAAAGGAAGLVLVHDFPRDQVAGQYAPYEGERWKVPAVYVGADEGATLRRAARRGASATIRTTVDRAPSTTRNLVATLPGQSNERIVVQSHTDGMNAVWDNGPAAMLALLDYFAALPVACRPRTLQFVFTTAHLHLTQSGAWRFAEVLDEEYESGTVAFVMAIEHLGAKEFAAVPRRDGPGRRLEPTGRSELFVTFAMESPVLIAGMLERIVARDLRRTVLARGADVPQLGFPPHRSFGGEGGPYREHLVPTIAGITGPWTLYNPAFGIDELIDFGLMRRQTMFFGDLVLAMDDVPRQLLAGADTVYRVGRELLGESEGHQPTTTTVHDHSAHDHGETGADAAVGGESAAATGDGPLPATGGESPAGAVVALGALAGVALLALRRRLASPA